MRRIKAVTIVHQASLIDRPCQWLGRRLFTAAMLALVVVLAGCEAGKPWGWDLDPLREPAEDDASTGLPTSDVAPADADASDALTEPQRFPGTGRYVQSPRQLAAVDNDGDIILNFENIEIREVVREILGSILKRNYVYDPRVQGTVSLQTTRPLPADAVLATLETILRQNGAALVESDGVFRVIPAAEAVQAQARPQLSDDATPIERGYRIMVVPLRFISAVQMAGILEPLLPPEGVIRVDTDRNLVILAGTSQELATLVETVRVFDVDWLRGMSAGLFPLENVGAEQVAEDLEMVFGDLAEGPLAGLIRLFPIDRLNALLVVANQPDLLAEAETWISRLDRGAEAGQSLFVYYVQNGKAADLAAILNDIFAERESADDELRRDVAPGLEAITTEAQATAPRPTEAATPAPTPAPPSRPRGGVRQTEQLAFDRGANIRIIADEINNALLVLASARDFRMVQAALRKLDIVPLQVLIDATIADVTLTEQLRYGVQHFLDLAIGRETLQSTFSTGTTAALAGTFPGLSVSYVAGDVSAILDALESVTTVNIISSPRLMVLDNQTARLQIGDEVPVITTQQQSTDANANVVNNVEFRETGVILEVTPRVNSGGLVTLDIDQEVSNVSTTAQTGDLTPTITQRKIQSAIAVQSGETVFLGGLIQQLTNKTRRGIPLLSRIPLLGFLFSATDDTDTQTELIVLLTPRVVRNPNEARQVTNEIRRRLDLLAPDPGHTGRSGADDEATEPGTVPIADE